MAVGPPGDLRDLFRPLDTIREEELGDDLPVTHVLFLPKEENLPSAPFPCVGKSDKSDEEALATPILTETEVGVLANLRLRLSQSARNKVQGRGGTDDLFSRVRYGQQVAIVVRLADPKAGFGRRQSPVAGSYQLL